MKSKIVILVLLLSCAAFMGLKLKLDNIPRTQVPGASIIYIPSGKSLQYASFGNSTLMADLIYLWAIQYFSNTLVEGRFDHLEHVFSIIGELDPLYLDPYQIGALISIYEARDLGKAYRILEMGLRNNPDQWIFPMQAGHYAQMLVKDFQTAQKYYQMVLDIPDAPAIAQRLYANAAYELSDYKTALQNWVDIYENTTDDRIKKIAENHIYRTKAAIDIEAISQAINLYKEKLGTFPDELSLLVKDGLMDSIPKDLDGNSYKYDNQSGKVESETWWKR